MKAVALERLLARFGSSDGAFSRWAAFAIHVEALEPAEVGVDATKRDHRAALHQILALIPTVLSDDCDEPEWPVDDPDSRQTIAAAYAALNEQCRRALRALDQRVTLPVPDRSVAAVVVEKLVHAQTWPLRQPLPGWTEELTAEEVREELEIALPSTRWTMDAVRPLVTAWNAPAGRGTGRRWPALYDFLCEVGVETRPRHKDLERSAVDRIEKAVRRDEVTGAALRSFDLEIAAREK